MSRLTAKLSLAISLLAISFLANLTLARTSLAEPADSHWAFQSLTRPKTPVTHETSPIDAFLARAQPEGLSPLGRAERRTLVRRVYIDLLGLPPQPRDVADFATDTRVDAYERMVERVLSSPAYGERWGQHWLDLARFAETDGFEHDKLRPVAWRYRDWVVQSLNEDLPFDQFVQQQIAGDQLLPASPSAWIATGFALCGPDMPDINSQLERKHIALNDITSTVGSVFLGLRIGCAQCHDHKSDPISQTDFYRLRAFFENAVPFKDVKLPGIADKGRVLSESAKRKEAFVRLRGDFQRKGSVVHAAVPQVLQENAAASGTKRAELAKSLTKADHPLVPRVIANRLWQHHFGRGLVATPSDFGLAGEAPSHPELLDWLATELVRRDWSLKAIHRIILRSSAYQRRSRPSELEEDSLRTNKKLDPNNIYLWRQNRRRLDAESLRDSLLFVSGRLSQRRGGSGVMPPLPPEIRKSIRGDHWKESPDEEDHFRRSLYLLVRRNLRYPFFEVFDRPDTNVSCARRAETTIAPQSLALLNSNLSVQAARHLAGRVLEQGSDSPRDWVRELFLIALGRPPTENELDSGQRFLSKAAELRAKDDAENGALPIPHPPRVTIANARALTLLSLATLNLSEFLYVD